MNYARKIYYGKKIEEEIEEKKSQKSKKTEDANRNLSR